MPVNNYTIGKDVTVDIIGPAGPLRFKVRTGFEPKQGTVDIKVKRADGITDHLILPDGWSGTLDFERQGPELDDYFAQWEADYYAGRNFRPLSITETITESDGSISQYRYTDVVLKYDSAGGRAGDTTVKQKVGFMAARRHKIA